MKKIIAAVAALFVLACMIWKSTTPYAAPTEATSVVWDTVAQAAGYKVYCSSSGSYGTASPRVVTQPSFTLGTLPDGVYDCVVSAFNDKGESLFSPASVPKVQCSGGKCYPLDVVPPPARPSMCTAAPAPRYAVVANASAADGSRPLQRLKDPAQPYSSTNKLVPLTPEARIAAGTSCEGSPLVVKTAAGYWLWATNAGGIRGIALCQLQ